MTDKVQKEVTKAIADFLASDDSFQGYGFGSQAINAGFIGKVEKYELTSVQGPGISKRRDPQMLNLKTGPIAVADAGEYSVAPSIVFEGGARQITLNTLTAHPESYITTADGDVTFAKMTGKQWGGLVGKTIECLSADNDENRKVPRIKRYSDSNETELRPLRKYAFKVL